MPARNAGARSRTRPAAPRVVGPARVLPGHVWLDDGGRNPHGGGPPSPSRERHIRSRTTDL
jgi:hypothetical protein